MKKLYVKPNLKVISIMPHHFFAESRELTLHLGDSSSRKADSWDEDEDEIEDSMWK